MRRRLAPLLTLVTGTLVGLALIDALLFRSGLYWHFAEPQSTAGASVGSTLVIARYHDPGRKNVLMLGDSRVGEGFSAQRAEAASGRADLHFINAAIPGTQPRVWNYQLRAVDPAATRFAAVALMAPLDLPHTERSLDDFSLDTNHALPWLRLSDLADFPASFTDANERARARRAILFPLQALREDVLGFAMAPRARLAAATTARANWLTAVAQYAGRDEALPDLLIDAANGRPRDWAGREAELKPKLEPYFRELQRVASPERQAANDAYLGKWLGRIARRYQATGVPVFVYAIPRGPWHRTLAPAPSVAPAVAAMAATGMIHALPSTAFAELERPEFFFDALHMNRAGRERFSTLFAEQVAPLLH
jgi:hypothetical protein